MAFSLTERERFVRVLRSKGWTLVDGTLWSPSRGLYFNDAHFEHWSVAEMRDVFTQRCDRIQKAAFDEWALHVGENRDVCTAAKDVLSFQIAGN